MRTLLRVLVVSFAFVGAGRHALAQVSQPPELCILPPLVTQSTLPDPACGDHCPTYERWKKRSSNAWTTGREKGFLDDTKLPNFSGAGRDPAMWTHPFGGTSSLGWANDRDHKSAFNHVFRPTQGDPSNRQTLVVFLHGGNGGNANHAEELYRFVAGKGYYVIGLDWLNDASPTPMCTCNSTCYGDLFTQL